MNIRAGDNLSQVASAQRNIMQHYSTELKLQQVVELSAVDKEIRRLQAKRTAIVAGTVDPSTSTPNPNLTAPQSATLNPFGQPFASTLPFPVAQPWTMPGYATPFQTSLFGVPGGQLMAGAGTQVGLQLPTSMSQPPAQPPPGDGLSVPEGSQVQQVRAKILQIPTQIRTRRRKSVTRQLMPSEKDVSSLTVSR